MAEVGKPVNFRRIDGTCLYRSSRPEGPATSHVFKSAGIKTILDLRDASEVCTSQGCDDYQLVSLKQPSKPNQELVLKPAASKNTRNSGVYAGRHVMAQFLRHSKIPADEPPWIKVILLVLYLIDRLIGTQMARNLTIKWVLHKEGDQALCWLYRHFVDHHGRNICAALRLLVDPSHVPAVVICAMGKDRTGVISALIGHICGRTKEQLVEDYAKTQDMYDTQPDHALIRGITKVGLPEVYKYAPREAMQHLLDHIEARYGSIDDYLDSIGFGREYREKLRHNSMEQKQ